MDWRNDLRALIERVPDEELPDLVAELARADLVTRQRYLEPNHTAPTPASNDGEDRLLTVDEAANLLSVKPAWLYRNAARLPFSRKLSPKALRFSERGLHRYLATQRL